MAELTILDLLDFPTPHVGYEDKEKREVCGCCGTYYVVQPGELKDIKSTVTKLYEALKACTLTLKTLGHKHPDDDILWAVIKQAEKALAEGRTP